MSLWLLLLLPLVGAVCVFLAKASIAKWIALGISTIVFVISILMAVQFDQWGTPQNGLVSHDSWLSQLGITLDLGVDSVAMLLVLLTTLLSPLCVWGSFTAITSRRKEYYAWLLILETALRQHQFLMALGLWLPTIVSYGKLLGMTKVFTSATKWQSRLQQLPSNGHTCCSSHAEIALKSAR